MPEPETKPTCSYCDSTEVVGWEISMPWPGMVKTRRWCRQHHPESQCEVQLRRLGNGLWQEVRVYR